MQAAGTARPSLTTTALQDLDDVKDADKRALIRDVAGIIFAGTPTNPNCAVDSMDGTIY